eukprot:4566841-Pyramimonas_sp.AAC.1
MIPDGDEVVQNLSLMMEAALPIKPRAKKGRKPLMLEDLAMPGLVMIEDVEFAVDDGVIDGADVAAVELGGGAEGGGDAVDDPGGGQGCSEGLR